MRFAGYEVEFSAPICDVCSKPVDEFSSSVTMEQMVVLEARCHGDVERVSVPIEVFEALDNPQRDVKMVRAFVRKQIASAPQLAIEGVT